VKKLLIIAPYPLGEAPSQRFRFEQYLSHFEKNGWQCELHSFWSISAWKVLYQKGKYFQKFFGLLTGFARRFFLLFRIRSADAIFIHREAAPIGPPFFEWVIAKIFHRKFIYDFDDAIWKPNVSASNGFANRFKWYNKVGSICKWASVVTCGNKYLCEYAFQFNHSVEFIPTTIDTSYHLPGKKNNTIPVIGWTGSHSTTYYLNALMPVFKKIEEQFQFELRIISNKDLQLPLKSYRFIEWKKETEISELQQFDIGIMPLPNDEWSKGKCGFKLLQYMAVGVPSVASPVGVNTEIVLDKLTGWIASTDSDWQKILSTLLQNKTERESVIENARTHIENNYSVNAMREKYLTLLNSISK